LNGLDFGNDLIKQIADARIAQLANFGHFLEAAAATDEFEDELLFFRRETGKERQGEIAVDIGSTLVTAKTLDTQYSLARRTGLGEFFGDILHFTDFRRFSRSSMKINNFS